MTQTAPPTHHSRHDASAAPEIEIAVDRCDWQDLANRDLCTVPENKAEMFWEGLWLPALDYIDGLEELVTFRGRGSLRPRVAYFRESRDGDLEVYLFEQAGRNWEAMLSLISPRESEKYAEIDDHPAAAMAQAWTNHQIKLED